MAIRKLSEQDVQNSIVPQPIPGRRPKSPTRIDQRLQQLVAESNTWIRLFREVWFFPPPAGMLELAVGASDHPDMPERYDEAIELMRWIAASADYGAKRLQEGKKNAVRRLTTKAAVPSSRPSRKKVKRK